MSKFKDVVKMMFIFEVVVTILFVSSYGVEGTARVFCDMFNTDTCKEVDWQE